MKDEVSTACKYKKITAAGDRIGVGHIYLYPE
ncbi:hypothetical protein EPYR_01516 [Erwinia pyrifoliae DSM 12163]|nr:hypothetical protein EPYR_01516 [Erwinia pyrifoliae DSM 12163]